MDINMHRLPTSTLYGGETYKKFQVCLRSKFYRPFFIFTEVVLKKHRFLDFQKLSHYLFILNNF